MEDSKTPGFDEKSKVSLLVNVKPQAAKPQIGVFYDLINEIYGDKLRKNEMTGKPERFDDTLNAWVEWNDVDDARLAGYFQSSYGLYNLKMLEKATMIYFDNKKVNPLIDLLESLEWDGVSRIERFLSIAVKCEDTPYNREVSRLIFAGGIHRAYRPGCKFDDMPVLVGAQGGGKSTLVRWLNIEDQYFREIKTISGKEGIEALRGVWIGEVAELMAMTRVKEAEAVKAYITAQEDSYRAPYNRHIETIPRRCTFIGTTNNPQFLSDKTGNRRFYPVQCKEDGYALLAREEEIKELIRKCWAEAVALYRTGKLDPYAKKELLDDIKEAQAEAMEDDWRVGAIKGFLENCKKDPESLVCVIELWHYALDEPDDRKPERADSIEIGKIMNEIPGWERSKKPVRLAKWGTQRVWKKVDSDFYPF